MAFSFSHIFNICQRNCNLISSSFNNKSIFYSSLRNCHHVPSASVGRQRQTMKYLIGGIAIGTASYCTYTYFTYDNIKNAASLSLDQDFYKLQTPPPPPKVTSHRLNPDDESGLKITLYQYQTCPFCCKVRAYLDYFGISYDVVEVNSILRTETKWSSYRKVPFLIIQENGKEEILQLKDSSLIISALHSYLLKKNKALSELLEYYPAIESTTDGKKKVEIQNKYFLVHEELPFNVSDDEISLEAKWRTWVDEDYVHVLSPNIYRTREEAFESFKWFAEAGNWREHFSNWQVLSMLYIGSVAMYFIGKKLKKKYALRDDVRAALYEDTNKWLKEIKKRKTPFLGGHQPNLADLGVYGILTAIEGCQAFTDLQENTKISKWYNAMKVSVSEHQGAHLLSVK